MVGHESLISGLSPAVPMRVKIGEALQISSLKGDQISAQGFSPGLGNSRRRALKGQHIPARQIGSKSFARVSSSSRHFQGAFLRGGYPGLKPRAELFCPFGAQTLYPSLMLTRMGGYRTRSTRMTQIWALDLRAGMARISSSRRY